MSGTRLVLLYFAGADIVVGKQARTSILILLQLNEKKDP